MGGMMGKRNRGNGRAVNPGAWGQGRGQAGGDVRDEPDVAAGGAGDVHEHLNRDLARVRAKFAQDPPPGRVSLAGAWMSETGLEEYEAEFVDTVADCLGAGLSLNDALSCWDSGELVSDSAEDAEAAAAEDEPPPPIVAPVVRRSPTGGHRLFVR